MTKFEKVLKGLECCKTDPTFESDCEDKGCPYKTDLMQCINHLCTDALELLKEQEPVKPIKVNRYMELDQNDEWHIAKTYDYGICRKELSDDAKYCPECGREVKWDD